MIRREWDYRKHYWVFVRTIGNKMYAEAVLEGGIRAQAGFKLRSKAAFRAKRRGKR